MLYALKLRQLKSILKADIINFYGNLFSQQLSFLFVDQDCHCTGKHRYMREFWGFQTCKSYGKSVNNLKV